MSTEEALHFGLIPRMHRGIFAMNEVPELDELVQVGLFNILEERDVQIRGYPVQFDLDVLILFSANPATYNRQRQGHPAAEGPHRLADPDALPARPRRWASRSWSRKRASTSAATSRCSCRYFMKEIIEQISICARKSKYVDHQSGVSARFSIANYRTMVASARHRGVRLGEKPAVPRISDLGHLLFVVAGQAGTGHDGQPADVGEAGARGDHRRGDPHGVRGVRREARPGRDRRRCSARA